MTTCLEFVAGLDAFVDGELPVDRAVDAECHVAACLHCSQRVRFEKALRSSIKNVVRAEAGDVSGLQQRMAHALIRERASHQVHACTPSASNEHWSSQQQALPRTNVRSLSRAGADKPSSLAAVASHPWGSMRWRTLLPLAAVAASVIVYAGVQQSTAAHGHWTQASSSDLKLSELDTFIDSMVNRHQATKHQPQVVQFSAEERLEPPFQLPPFQDPRNAAYPNWTSNANLAALRGTSSAYQVRGHRVTFFAYEAAAAPLRARLEGHSLRGHVVYVGQRQGYSVATVEEGPVGFAMTSDLPPLENAELIASAVDARVQH